VGVTAFLGRLEAHFLNQLKDQEIPAHLDPHDGKAVKEWFREAFGYWLLEHRDEVLAREWVRRGWAEYVLKPDPAGGLHESHRVKPEFVETIDDWLQDKVE
jgi:hypothetical protein